MDIMLETGEYLIGRYKVRIASFTRWGWQGDDTAWMHAHITNHRLLLLPEAPTDPHATQSPLAFTAQDLKSVWNACLGRRDGVIIERSNGQLLHLLVHWSQGAKMARDLKEILVPLITPRISPQPPSTHYDA